LVIAGCFQRDQVSMSLQKTATAQNPVPEGLREPDKWILVTNKYVPNVAQQMVWHKVTDPAHPERYSESFEFLNTPRQGSPEDALAAMRQGYAKSCPSGNIQVIAQTDTDLTLENKPCGPLGEEDSISHWTYGIHDQFYASYNVKGPEMTADQRKQGLEAVGHFHAVPGKNGIELFP